MNRSKVTEEQIREIARRIGEQPGVVQVWLFGSHATGTAGPDSDVDLLAVYEDAVAGRYPAGFGMVSRERAEELLQLMDRAWALFEPRIAEVLAVRAADEDADEAEADEPDADRDA